MIFIWSRDRGYECSSQGDVRFSALFARMPDGRTIEEHYQCDVKGYQPGGRNWRLGKGKPAAEGVTVDLWPAYLALWQRWAEDHPEHMADLARHGEDHGFVLRDRFATGPINQAHALAELLNAEFLRK